MLASHLSRDACTIADDAAEWSRFSRAGTDVGGTDCSGGALPSYRAARFEDSRPVGQEWKEVFGSLCVSFLKGEVNEGVGKKVSGQ